MIKKMLAFFLIGVGFSFVFVGLCQGAEKVEFEKWLQKFKAEALAVGISQNALDQAFDRVRYNDLVIKLDRNQPEFKLSLSSYLARTVSDTKVRNGKVKLRENAQILSQIEKKYGIPANYLVAFWGIETDYGRVTGSFPVVESLATLTYDPRRSAFFKKELLAALRIIDGGYITARQMEGSWAGAMGYLQFLPSVFEKYKIDFDNDGKIEIWNNHGDLFSTAANYLSTSGWQPGWKWGREVIAGPAIPAEVQSLSTTKKISDWQRLGVRTINGNNLPKANIKASLIKPDSDQERFFLIYDNFRVIMKWNRSTYYAVAVGLLADRIKE